MLFLGYFTWLRWSVSFSLNLTSWYLPKPPLKPDQLGQIKCYWWTWCEWQVAPPLTRRQRREEMRKGSWWLYCGKAPSDMTYICFSPTFPPSFHLSSISQGYSGIELLDLLLEPHKGSHVESDGDLSAWSITDQSVSEMPFDIYEFIWSITRQPSY